MFDIWNSISLLRQPCLKKAATEPAIDSGGATKDSVLRAIDNLLWEDVGRSLIEIDLHPTQHESLYTRDKWLTTSALQKCIRRGHTDLAERYVRSSVRIDADHTFRRLAVICLEDVGLGDLKLVASALAILGDKRRRQRLGEEWLAANLAVRMSMAVKSRLACEMLSLVDYNTGSAKFAETLYRLDAEALSQIIRTEATGSSLQLVSLWLLHGSDRLRSRHLLPIAGSGYRGLLKLLNIERLPLIFHYIVRMGLSRCRDALAIPYVALAKLADQHPYLKTESRTFPPPQMFGAYPSFAYDMHTRPGRLAIREFEVNCTGWLQAEGIRDVGNLIFALEGGLLDMRLKGAEASRISEEARCLEVFGVNQPPPNDWIFPSNLLSILDEFRRRAAVSA